MSNSKYSYSDPSEIYEEVRPYIKEGKIVVFIGLPCQIAGYKKTFGNKDNLYYVDLVCHGVAPNSYLRQHISKIEQKVGVRAAEMSFRAPEMGTANYYFTLYDNDGKISYAKRSIDGDNYNIAFHRGYSYRENCYHCHYARPERCSDLTIGDYHGLGKLQPCDFDNDNVSVILANTDKGNELLKRLIDAELVAVYERPVEEPIQGDSQLRHPTLKSKFRYDFEKYIVRYNGNFEMTVTKVLKNQKQREAATRVYSLPKRVVKKILRICHICNLMKKVGIITIHNSPNYGACLQSFALYEYIRQQGYDVSIIDLHRPYHYDYKPSKKYVPYKNRFETFTQKCKRCIKRVLHSAVSFMRKEGNKPIILSLHNELTPFDKFNTKISLSRPYYGIDELYANPPVYDTYITGSDQVWNPTQSYCIEPYFLTFAKNGRKISYASSVGIKTLTKKEKNDFSKWLRQYEAVSVREPSAQELLSSISGVEIGQVSDPTFLLDIEYWKKLAVTPSFSEYIMVFTLSFDQSMIEYGLKIAEESGKKLISVNMVQPDDDRYIVIRDASPEEWLGLIEDADMVLTDSFHCTLFSILLGTENFFTYIAPWNIRGSRIEDLLHSVGLLDHLLDIGLRDDFATLSHKMINHDEIAAIVDKERARSRSFLLNNI